MTLLSEIAPRFEITWTSYSGLTQHRSCPQAWMYGQIYGLSRAVADDPAPERRFGTMWAALRAAERIERGRRLGSLKVEPKDIKIDDDAPRIAVDQDNLPARVLDAVERWGDALSEDHQAVWKDKLGQQPGERLAQLDASYREQWAEETETEQPLAVEVKWVKQIPGSTAVLLGYADEIYFDRRRNLTIVRDDKTSKQLSTQSTADDMMDSQLHLYPWGLMDQVKNWNVPPIQAVAFDRVRSVKPTTPRLTPKTRKLSAQVTQYDLATYLAFVAETEDYEAEESVLAHLRSPVWRSVWFQRTRTPLNRNMMREHLQAAVDSMKDTTTTIERVKRRGAATRNFTGTACRWCEFAKLCRAQMVGGSQGEYQIEEYGLRVRPTK